MPRYFFDTHDGRYDTDAQGVELVNLDAACAEARRYLLPVACLGITQKGDNEALSVVVRDEANAVVYIARLTFAGIRFVNEVTKVVI